MDPGAFEVNNISAADVSGSPEFEAAYVQMLTVLHQQGGARPLLISYNGHKYDWPVILRWAAEMSESGKQAVADLGFEAIYSVDAFMLVTDALSKSGNKPHNFKQVTVYEFITGKSMEGAHDALADAAALGEMVHHPSWPCRTTGSLFKASSLITDLTGVNALEDQRRVGDVRGLASDEPRIVCRMLYLPKIMRNRAHAEELRRFAVLWGNVRTHVLAILMIKANLFVTAMETAADDATKKRVKDLYTNKGVLIDENDVGRALGKVCGRLFEDEPEVQEPVPPRVSGRNQVQDPAFLRFPIHVAADMYLNKQEVLASLKQLVVPSVACYSTLRLMRTGIVTDWLNMYHPTYKGSSVHTLLRRVLKEKFELTGKEVDIVMQRVSTSQPQLIKVAKELVKVKQKAAMYVTDAAHEAARLAAAHDPSNPALQERLRVAAAEHDAAVDEYNTDIKLNTEQLLARLLVGLPAEREVDEDTPAGAGQPKASLATIIKETHAMLPSTSTQADLVRVCARLLRVRTEH